MRLTFSGLLLCAVLILAGKNLWGQEETPHPGVQVTKGESYTSCSRRFEDDGTKILFISRYYHEDTGFDNVGQLAVVNLIGAVDKAEPNVPWLLYSESIYTNGHTAELGIGGWNDQWLHVLVETYPPDRTQAIMVLRKRRLIAALGKNTSGGFDLSDNKALRRKIIAFNPGAEETLPEDWQAKNMAKTPGKHPSKEDGRSEKSVGGEDAESEPQSTPRIDKRRKEYKQSTPRELLESFIKAGQTNDYRGLLDIFHPDARKAAKPLMEMLAAQKEAVEELGHVVRDKVDEELGDKIIGAVREGAGVPFGDVVEDGAIRWDWVNIHRQGDKATVTIEGKVGTAVFTKVNGKWYLDPSERDLEGMLAEYETAQKWTSRGIDAIRQLIDSIRAGRIQTVEEFKRQETQAMDRAFGNPLPEPEEESGPSVRRTPKDPIEDLDEIRQQP